MTKEEFNKLDIHAKVDYINSNIQRFGSASNVCKALNVNIDTFRNNIRNLYTYIPYLQKYIRISDLENCLDLSSNDQNTLIIMDAQEHKVGDSSSTGLVSIDNAQEKLIDLLNNYDKIVDLLKNAQEHPQSIHGSSENFMDLNMPSSTLKKTTIRVNEDIWNDFKSCIETEFGHLEQFDLISVALRDFVNKYSIVNNKKDV